jgi:hypothetical protein
VDRLLPIFEVCESILLFPARNEQRGKRVVTRLEKIRVMHKMPILSVLFVSFGTPALFISGAGVPAIHLRFI